MDYRFRQTFQSLFIGHRNTYVIDTKFRIKTFVQKTNLVTVLLNFTLCLQTISFDLLLVFVLEIRMNEEKM